MKTFIFIISFILIISFQVSFLSHFVLHRAIPNLVLVVLVSWSILQSYNQAYLLALLGGVVLDLYSGTLFGLHALSLVCLVMVTYLITQHFLNKDDILSRILIIILATLGYQFIFLGFISLAKILHLTDDGIFLSEQFLSFLFWQILVNLVVLFIIFPMVKAIHNFLAGYEKRAKTKV